MSVLPHQSGQIQNQPDPSIAQNGAPGHSLNFLEPVAQTLDYDLLLADQLIHHQTESPPVAFGHDQQALAGIFGTRPDAKLSVKPHHGEQVSAHHHHLAPILDRENALPPAGRNISRTANNGTM